MWCVSDVLLRDAWGQLTHDPQALAAELTTSWIPVEELAGNPEGWPHRRMGRARESFHARWGRPADVISAWRRRSVVTVRVSADLPGSTLAGSTTLTAWRPARIRQVQFQRAEVTVAAPRSRRSLAWPTRKRRLSSQGLVPRGDALGLVPGSASGAEPGGGCRQSRMPWNEPP